MVMDRDHTALGLDNLESKVVTKRPPTEEEMRAMRFAWRVVKHVKSNAIVYAKSDRTLGIGAGQMSRVDSSRIAVWKAKEAGLDLRARSSRRTPCSPSRTACKPRSKPAPPPASSPAARCVMKK